MALIGHYENLIFGAMGRKMGLVLEILRHPMNRTKLSTLRIDRSRLPKGGG